MRRKSSAGLAVIATLVFIFFFSLNGPRTAAAFDNAHWGANYFPNITLTTQDGKTVHFYDDLIKGKIVVVYLMYTTCKYMCPLETARLVQVQRMLGDRVGKDIFFYGLSIDPKNDTPAALKAYAEKYHIGPGFLLLTGKAQDIELLSRRLGLYSDPDPVAYPDGHMPYFLMGNEPMGQWLRDSALDNPRFMARTISEFLDKYRVNAPEKAYAEAKPYTFGKGEYVFNRHCAACHTIGKGDSLGPDLLNVTRTRDPKWLWKEISTPEKLLEEKDPLAQALFKKYKNVVMPNLNILNEDVEAVIKYMESQSAAVTKPAAAAAAPEKAGTATTAPSEMDERRK
jgi:protein SCO1